MTFPRSSSAGTSVWRRANPRASSTTETLTEEDFVEPNVVLQELQNETRGRLNQNLMLTNEGKIADVDVNVFWNVKNARDFLFNVKGPVGDVGWPELC